MWSTYEKGMLYSFPQRGSSLGFVTVTSDRNMTGLENGENRNEPSLKKHPVRTVNQVSGLKQSMTKCVVYINCVLY